MNKIYKVKVNAPVSIGDILFENIDGEGTNLVATSQCEKIES
jgi:CxxC motif-containing protein